MAKDLSVFIRASPATVFDFAATLANLPGERVTVPLRVRAKGDGSDVVFTLIPGPGMSEAQVENDAKMVMRDLNALKKAVEG